MTIDRKRLVNLARSAETLENKGRQRVTPVGNSWFSFSNRVAGATDIYILDEIGMYGVTAQNFIMALSDVDTSQVNLHLSSFGGDIKDGIAIYNALLDMNAELHVYVDSIVASAASFIAMAGDTIKMRKASKLMIHEANGGAMGTASDMREMAGILEGMTDMIAQVYADRSGKPVEGWKNLMVGSNGTGTWFTPQEALEAGLVDEILDMTEDDEANNRQSARMTNEAKPEIGFSLDFKELFTAVKEGMK